MNLADFISQKNHFIGVELDSAAAQRQEFRTAATMTHLPTPPSILDEKSVRNVLATRHDV